MNEKLEEYLAQTDDEIEHDIKYLIANDYGTESIRWVLSRALAQIRRLTATVNTMRNTLDGYRDDCADQCKKGRQS